MSSPMTSRSGLSIRARTVIGYSLIVLLALFTLTLSIIHLRTSEASIQTIQRGSERLLLIADFRISWDELLSSIDRMLLTRQRSMANAEVQPAVTEMNGLLDSLVISYPDGTGAEQLANLNLCLAEVVEAIDSISYAAENGEWAKAQIVHHTDLASIERRLEINLQALERVTNESVDAETDEIARKQDFLGTAEFILAFLVIVLGIVIAIVTSSSIIRPIEYLASSVRSMTPEGLERKLDVSRNDEIGELARAYNSMTEKIHFVLTGLEDQIDAYRKIQVALTDSERRYRNLFQHSPVALCELDLSKVGRILQEKCSGEDSSLHDVKDEIFQNLTLTDVNSEFLKLFGANEPESLYKFDEHIPVEMSRILLDVFCNFSRGRTSFTTEMEIVNLQGERKQTIAHFAVAPLTRGEYSKVFVAMQDVTARKRMEEALRISQEQYHHAQKMEAVGRLTGGIAHDFNNILTVILSNCEIALMDNGISPKLKSMLDQIKGAASRAASVTQQLLAFSHQTISNPVNINVNNLLLDITSMLSRVIGEDIELVTDFDSDIPGIVADQSQIEQVILNLAVNARDAMPAGGRLKISTSCTSITEDTDSGSIDEIPAAGYVQIIVEDNGTGMAKDVLDKAFDPYFTTKEKGKGTGLGLASVHGIIASIGGYIDVESSPGNGTRFTLNIPSATSTPMDSDEVPAKMSSEMEDATVLLVEDENSVREVVSNALRMKGYEVIEAYDGDSALRQFQLNSNAIELLISDIVLPGTLNGIQIARELTRRKNDLRVLLMSGYYKENANTHPSIPENVNFIAKPFTVIEFLLKVRDSLH